MTTNNVFSGPMWYKDMRQFELELWRSMGKPDRFYGYVVEKFDGKATYVPFATVHEAIARWHYDIGPYDYVGRELLPVTYAGILPNNHVHYRALEFQI